MLVDDAVAGLVEGERVLDLKAKRGELNDCKEKVEYLAKSYCPHHSFESNVTYS